MNRRTNRKFYLYLLDTLADWEIGFITAEINSGRYLLPGCDCELIKLGISTEPVTTMGGLSLSPDLTIDEAAFSEGDALILPGAESWMNGKHNKLISMVPALLERGVIVAAVCGATFALAQSGLLDSRRHTSNAPEVLKMLCPDYKGEKYYQQAPAVSDQGLITASGLAPVDFSRELFRSTSVMRPETLESWYQLYTTGDSQYFFSLMESLS